MKFRSLLLGTATVFAVAGGAKAADLTVAEAVDYVKVCDAYGHGYAYIPGTDTCLRIGGYVQMDLWFQSTSRVGNIDGQDVTVPFAGTWPVDVSRDSYSASWEYKTEAGVNFTGRTMSDLGPVVTFVDLRVSSNNDSWSGYEKYVHPDTYYGSIGPLLFGYTESLFDFNGGYTYDGSIREDLKTDQIRWSYMMGTWGLMLGLEDPRDRYGSAPDGGGHAKNATGDFPDIILALTGSAGGWSWEVTGGVTDRTSGTGWGVSAGFQGDLGGGFKLRAQGAYSDNAPTFVGVGNCTGLCGDEGAWWSALVSGIVALSSNVNAAATFSYADGPSGGDEQWQGAIGAYWAATATSEIGLEFLYHGFGSSGSDDYWGVHARFLTKFGG